MTYWIGRMYSSVNFFWKFNKTPLSSDYKINSSGFPLVAEDMSKLGFSNEG